MTDTSEYTDPHAAEGERLAISLVTAGLRDDLVGIGLLLEPVEPSVERSALIIAIRLLVDQIRIGAAEHGVPAEAVLGVFRAGLLRLG